MMSRDRVVFLVTREMFAEPEFKGAFELAIGKLGFHVSAIAPDGMEVTVRPSQFARFLIFRNDNGGRNSFKALKPRLISAPVSDNVPTYVRTLDLSRNPATP